MYGILISLALLFPQTRSKPIDPPVAQETTKAASLDGNWTVVCYERDGQPVDAAKNAVVTFKDNTIKFEPKDGTTKMKSMRVEFGKEGTLRVTETDTLDSVQKNANGDNAKAGVYVVSKNHLAICLHDESTIKDGNGIERTGAASTPSMKSKCTIFLKRSDTPTDR